MNPRPLGPEPSAIPNFATPRNSIEKSGGRAAARPHTMEAPPRFELGHQDFADPCLTTWLWRRIPYYIQKEVRQHFFLNFFGASDEARTRYLHLGKVALYQMSYTRIWCPGPELNQRHADFQSAALPTELPGQISFQRDVATRKGLEPSTSGVTGRRSNQLNYRAT